MLKQSHIRMMHFGPSKSRGFALVLSLMLLSFVLLLMLAITATVRIETNVASGNQKIEEARNNALLGLRVALGQLQKHTGPDQRTTARADINAEWENDSKVNGRWLAAYGNRATIDRSYSTSPSAIPGMITGASNTNGSQAILLNWLVSGNENTARPTIDDNGRILSAAASFEHSPTDTTGLDQVSKLPSGNANEAILVGENTSAQISDYVSAPLVEIGGPQNNKVGRYAWWVGDEGAKARANLPLDPNADESESFVTAQRTAIELMDKENPIGSNASFDQDDLIGDDFDPTDSTLRQVFSLEDLNLSTGLSDQMKRLRSHDITGVSRSLFTDTYAGGLKQDLSSILSTGTASPPDSAYLFTPEPGTSDFAVPTWGLLRSFAQTTAPAAGLSPRLPTSTQVGISPVLTYYALGLEYTAPDGVSEGAPIRLALYPLVVLWNPYTKPIVASQYEIGYTVRFKPYLQLQVEDPDTPGSWTAKETINFSKIGGVNRSYLRFIIDAPEIPPGASMVFSLQGSEIGKNYSAPQNGLPTNILTNGFDATGHAFLSYGATFDADEVDSNFRAAVRGVMISWLSGSENDQNLSSGGADFYLGKVSTGRTDHITSTNNDKEWYQTINLITHGPGTEDGSAPALFQDEGPLNPPLAPTAAIIVEKKFSEGSVSPNTYPEIRWIAQNNPRAPLITQTIWDSQPLNYYGRAAPGLQLDQELDLEDPWKRASSGDSIDAGTEIVDTTLFEFRPETEPLLSLGQLQHANLSMLSSYPSYPIGNSLGDFHFKDNLDQVYLRHTMSQIDWATIPKSNIEAYYDLSWVLNYNFWDRYFVSTIPYSGTGTYTDTSADAIPSTLPNARNQLIEGANLANLRDSDKAAGEMELNGGFNINSTSEQAWRAVLGGINQLGYDPETGFFSNNKLQSPLPRFSRPTEGSGNKSWAWQGYRQLSDEQIAKLAKNIVNEIRMRGPFVSMADFINRRLIDNPATDTDERFKGTLQAALDASYTGTAAVNSGEQNAYSSLGENPFHDSTPLEPTAAKAFQNYELDLLKGYRDTTDEDLKAHGSRSAFAPQFLTQADILSSIGATLTARSDTFTIRSYGDVINPVTQTVEGRAWCEAVVQREYEYVSGNTPIADYPTPASIDQEMGRRYKIVSFRWLNSDEI